MLFKQFLYRTNTFQKGASLSDKGCQRSDAAHCAFLAKKNGQVGGGVQSSSNFSASVAITFKSSQCVLGCTESNVSQKEQTYCYPKSPDDRSNKITCKCIEFLIDSVDVTLVYEDDLQLQRRIRWFWQL